MLCLATGHLQSAAQHECGGAVDQPGSQGQRHDGRHLPGITHTQVRGTTEKPLLHNVKLGLHERKHCMPVPAQWVPQPATCWPKILTCLSLPVL